MNNNSIKPYFSVIIPTYNRAHILGKALLSVKEQTYTDWECIIVDDGSTDNTKEFVAKWISEDNRFRYIRQENAERSAARNNGIKNAKGKYVCFLDSDDEYLPSHLSVLYEKILAESEPEALFFTQALLSKNNEVVKQGICLMEGSSFDYLMEIPIIPARVCIHREILSRIKFREDIVIVEDQVLWANISIYHPVFQIPEHTVLYHVNEENSIDISKNCFRPRLNGLRKFFAQKDVRKVITKKLKNKIISECYFGIARYYGHKRRWFPYAWNLIVSIFYSPLHPQTKAKIHMIFFPEKHRLS
ncbi:MAG TPA: glycosyltransferase family 2 protein [Bacteroidales bacterium]|nr:glycosyltransferase family 2 protein [Bacteroidales bacterium]HQI71382.1 glycosyltransferase family 2 protein [Bacteroidales bacterium]